MDTFSMIPSLAVGCFGIEIGRYCSLGTMKYLGFPATKEVSSEYPLIDGCEEYRSQGKWGGNGRSLECWWFALAAELLR